MTNTIDFSHKALQWVIDDANFKAKLFDKEQAEIIDINKLTVSDADRLFANIDVHLSPENLHADGERPEGEVDRLYAVLVAGAKALHKMGFEPGEEHGEVRSALDLPDEINAPR